MTLSNDDIKQLRNSIERIPQFEEKLNVRLDNLSLKADNNSITVFGEFFMEDIGGHDWAVLHSTLHDENNTIIDRRETTIDLSSFLGFETFEILFWPITPEEVKKIRVYPKLE